MEFPHKEENCLNGPLIFSIISGVTLLGCLTFQWDIVDAVTPFLALPVIGLAYLIAIIGALVAGIHAVRMSGKGGSAFAPLSVSMGTFLLVLIIPFTYLWISANFHMKKGFREQVVSAVQSGIIKPNVSHNSSLIALPSGAHLSSGGDEIVVEGASGKQFVFFFTYRGILDNYSGFLWVPEGKRPEGFADFSDPGTEIVPYGGHWYFVGHK
ncbi:MAG: hypothetical protein JST40_05805 [Armatimonadetes bacterium]|nr:hypothetical protein [Armatimonadota bacterium]